jgi:hypothetical protein
LRSTMLVRVFRELWQERMLESLLERDQESEEFATNITGYVKMSEPLVSGFWLMYSSKVEVQYMVILLRMDFCFTWARLLVI